METDFFDIVDGVLQGDTLVPYLSRLCTETIDRSFERKWLYMIKARSRQYPAQTITDADYIDDIALLADTPTQAESLMHSLEQAAGSIGFHVNVDKTEYMWFNQKGDIFTLSGGSLKFVDEFTYVRSSVSSENDIRMLQVQA